MAETPQSPKERTQIPALPGQIDLSPSVYQPADEMAAQRQRGLEIAQDLLASSPNDPAAQRLVETMQSEVDRFAPNEQVDGP